MILDYNPHFWALQLCFKARSILFCEIEMDEHQRWNRNTHRSGGGFVGSISSLLGGGNRVSQNVGLPLHLAGLSFDRKQHPTSYEHVNSRDVYDDPFRSEKHWKRLLFGCLFVIGGFSLHMYCGGRWINDHMRWWHWLLGLSAFCVFCMGLTLMIFGHAWPPKQECSPNSEYRQSFQHNSAIVPANPMPADFKLGHYP